jgi:hypothetical protein
MSLGVNLLKNFFRNIFKFLFVIKLEELNMTLRNKSPLVPIIQILSNLNYLMTPQISTKLCILVNSNPLEVAVIHTFGPIKVNPNPFSCESSAIQQEKFISQKSLYTFYSGCCLMCLEIMKLVYSYWM